MQEIPIFSYPFTILSVDDDSLFLKTIERIINGKYPLKVFNNTTELTSYLNNYTSPLSNSLLLKSLKEHEYSDTLNNAPVNFDINNINKLATQQDRYKEIGILISDFNMPSMSGIELCEKLNYLPCKKILLTGEADYQQATDAFNKQLINCFIQKDNNNLEDKLLEYIKLFQYKYFNERTSNIKKHLEADYPLPCSDPEFATFFANWLEGNNIREYYLLDKNGGYLLINNSNEKFHFIIHTDQTLANFISTYEDDEKSILITKYILEGEMIPSYKAEINLDNLDANDLARHFYKANILNGRVRYYWYCKNISNEYEVNS